MQDIFKNAVEIEGFKCFGPDMAIKNDGFDPQGFRFLMEIEDKHFWFRERNQIILWAIKEFFPKNRVLLEIGCGTGYVASAIEKNFPNLQVYGSEIFIEGLKHASLRLKKEQLFQLDARRIPFDNVFDIIGMFDVLEHIDEDEVVLEQVYKALKPKGGIIITVPQHKFLWSKVDDYSYHKRRYSRKELKEKLLKTGFRVNYMNSFVTLLMPILVISRITNSVKKDFCSSKEFNLSPAINFISSYMLKVEQLLIRRKISLPFGGSLLAIAYKEE